MRIILTVLAFRLLSLSSAIAQGTQGAITGSIADSAGALMPGVRIEARNTATNALYQVVSSSTGTYTLAQLPPGTYQISVSVPGFKPYTRTGVSVSEAQIIRIDILMTMLASDEILTNESVLQLLKAGINEDLIISKIRDSQRNFDFSVQGMVALKGGGASDRLMHFMMDPTKAPEPKAAAAAPNPVAVPAVAAVPKEAPKTAEVPAAADPSLPKEFGVYFKAGKQWVEVQPEVVVWETGGMLKRFATAGIVQGDVNGRIKGAHSANLVSTPIEFLIVAPEGMDIADYQLIRLRGQRDTREFRTVTGGIFTSSGGATRDAIQFESSKLFSRTFSVNLRTLDDGEYGFLPTSGTAPSTSANVGKMFTFQVK